MGTSARFPIAILAVIVGCGGDPNAPFTLTHTLSLASGVTVEVTLEGTGRPPEGLLATQPWPDDPDALLALARDRDARAALLARLGTAAGERAHLTRTTFDDAGTIARFVRARARDMSRDAPPTLVLGWDGADPRVVEDMIRAGHLANVARLRRRGVFGRLRSHAPYLSPLLWTSVATGKRPEEHGILDFVEPAADGATRPVGTSCRRSTTLWDVLAASGRRQLVVNWWATAPADDVDGVIATDRWVRSGAPPAPTPTAERVDAEDPAVATIVGRLIRRPAGAATDRREAALATYVAEALTVQRVALEHLAASDDAYVYFGLIDQASHLFHREMPPRLATIDDAAFARWGGAVHGTYLLLDALLGELLAAAPDDADVLLVSDHGFVYGLERARALGTHDALTDLLHTADGIYVFTGPSFRRGAARTVDLHELAPTILVASGVPAAKDMAGVAAADLLVHAPPVPVPTHEIDLEPPDFGLIDGRGCGAPALPDGIDAAALERLAALGYLDRGGSDAGPVLPLANYGRSLLDAGAVEPALAALSEAVRRRPDDPSLRELELKALLQMPGAEPGRLEAAARAWLASGAGAHRGEAAFLLAQLLLRSNRIDDAEELAAEVSGDGVAGALTVMLTHAWTGDLEDARHAASRAAALDPLRTIDTVQGLLETFVGVDLGVDSLVRAIAPSIPLEEALRAPVSGLTGNPDPTLARAYAVGPQPDAADQLWLRRARAYGYR